MERVIGSSADIDSQVISQWRKHRKGMSLEINANVTCHLHKRLVRRQQEILKQTERTTSKQQLRRQVHGAHMRDPIGPKHPQKNTN